MKKLTQEEWIILSKKHYGYIYNLTPNSNSVDFEKIKLLNVDLSDINIRTPHSLYREIELDNVIFPKSACNLFFPESNIKNIDFENIDLKYSVFRDSKFENINFKNANLEDCTFRNSILKNINFENTDLTNVSFIDAILEKITINKNTKAPSEFFEKYKDQLIYSMEKISQEDFEKLYKDHLLWLDNKSQGKQLNLKNCDLSDILHSNLSIYYYLPRVILENVKLPKLTYGHRWVLSNSKLTNVEFLDNYINTSNFINSILTDIDFSKININDCYFDGTVFNNVKYNSETIKPDILKLIKDNMENVPAPPRKKITQEEFDTLYKTKYKFNQTKDSKDRLILENLDLSDIRDNGVSCVYVLDNCTLRNVKLPVLGRGFRWFLEKSELINVEFQGDLTSSSFENSNLTNVNFSNCYINNCNFNNSKLTNIIYDKDRVVNQSFFIALKNLKLIKLTQEEFDKKYFEHIKWINNSYCDKGKQLDLSDCDISSVNLDNKFDFRKSILTNTKFPKNCKNITFAFCELINTDFENSNLEDCNFFEVSFENVNLKNANLKGIWQFATGKKLNIIIDDRTVCSETTRKLINDWHLKNQSSLKNSNEKNLKGKILQEEFEKLHRSHVSWLIDKSQGKQLNLSNIDLSNIINDGANIYYLPNTILENVKLPKLNSRNRWVLSSSKLTNVEFSDESLKESNFSNSILTNIDFSKININECTFDDVILDNVKCSINATPELLNFFNIKAMPQKIIPSNNLDEDLIVEIPPRNLITQEEFEELYKKKIKYLQTKLPSDRLILENLDLSNIKRRTREFEIYNLEGVILKNVKLPQLTASTRWYLRDTEIDNVEFSDTNLISSCFQNSIIKNVNFFKININSCEFNNSIVDQTVIINPLVSNSSLNESLRKRGEKEKLEKQKLEKERLEKLELERLETERQEKEKQANEKQANEKQNNLSVRKSITQEEFDQKYIDHELWINTGKEKGRQLDLSNYDLSKISFGKGHNRKYRLWYAVFINTKFPIDCEALTFAYSNLTNSDFENSILINSNFFNTYFENTNLKHVDASNGIEFGQSQNLNIIIDDETKLPDDIREKIIKWHLNNKTTKRKKITKQEFKKAYDEHQKWKKDKSLGEQLHFEDVELPDDLILHDEGFYLDRTILINVQFKNAGAIFSDSNLKNSDFSLCGDSIRSNFDRANLENCNFTGIKSLGYSYFHHTKLTNTKFDDDLKVASSFDKLFTDERNRQKDLVKEELVKEKSSMPNVSERKKLTLEEFKKLHEDHKSWLADKSKGKQLHLENFEIPPLLKGNGIWNLQNSILINVKFLKIEVCVLNDSNLKNSDFSLCGDSINVNFENTNLENTNFTGIKSLERCYFNTKTILTNAKFDDDLKSYSNSIFEQERKRQKEKIEESKLSKPMKKLTQAEFNKLYRDHLSWLENSSRGKQLELSECDLSDIDVSYLNFSYAICVNTIFPHDCRNIKFAHSILDNANFENKDLGESEFLLTRLFNTNFKGANIFHCNFKNTYSLETIIYDYKTIVSDEFVRFYNNDCSTHYKKITQEEFDSLYNEHTKFLSNSSTGKQINLSNIDLRHIVIRSKDLKRSICENTIFGNIINTCFIDSNLKNAKFLNCNVEATFDKCYLANTDFSGSDLRKSYFDEKVHKVNYTNETLFNECNVNSFKYLNNDNIESIAKVSKTPEQIEQQKENYVAPEKAHQNLAPPERSDMTNPTVNSTTATANSTTAAELPPQVWISQKEFMARYVDHQLWLKNSKMGVRLELVNVSLYHESDDDINIDSLDFRKAKFKNVKFPYSMDDINFSETEMIDVKFVDGCSMSNLCFDNAKIINIRLKQPYIDKVTFNNTAITNITHDSAYEPLITRLKEIETNGNPPETAEIVMTEKQGLKNTVLTIVTTAKNQALEGAKIAAGNQTALIIQKHVLVVLKRLKVPPKILNNPVVKSLIMMVAPQILVLAMPYLPFEVPGKIQNTLKLSCDSSVAIVTEEAIEKAFELVLPSFLPMFKALEEAGDSAISGALGSGTKKTAKKEIIVKAAKTRSTAKK